MALAETHEQPDANKRRRSRGEEHGTAGHSAAGPATNPTSIWDFREIQGSPGPSGQSRAGGRWGSRRRAASSRAGSWVLAPGQSSEEGLAVGGLGAAAGLMKMG